MTDLRAMPSLGELAADPSSARACPGARPLWSCATGHPRRRARSSWRVVGLSPPSTARGVGRRSRGLADRGLSGGGGSPW